MNLHACPRDCRVEVPPEGDTSDVKRRRAELLEKRQREANNIANVATALRALVPEPHDLVHGCVSSRSMCA